MKNSLILAAVLCSAAAFSVAQTAPDPQNGGAGAATSSGSGQAATGMAKPQADAGTAQSAGPTIPAKLAKGVDSKKVKSGDEIDARTTVGMTAAGGLQVPEGSKIVGHITDAKAKSKGDPESSLSFAFEKIVLKDGKELPFRAIAQAIGQGQNAAAAAFPENGGPNSPQAKNGMPGGDSPSVGSGSTSGNASASNASPKGISATNASNGGLPENATGVVGIKGISLNNEPSASKISSDSKSVKLDEGTELLLRMIPQ